MNSKLWKEPSLSKRRERERKRSIQEQQAERQQLIARQEALREDVRGLLQIIEVAGGQGAATSMEVQVLMIKAQVDSLVENLCEKGELDRVHFNVKRFEILRESLRKVNSRLQNHKKEEPQTQGVAA